MRLLLCLSVIGVLSLACAGPDCDADEDLEDGKCVPEEDEDDDDGGGDTDLGGLPDDAAAACEEYFAAYEGCYVAYAEANGLDPEFTLSDTWCEETYGGMRDREVADYLRCLAEAYAEADCSTADGYTAAGTAAGTCTY